MEMQKITDAKLDELAEDPNNIVYKYMDLPAPDVVMSLPQVKEHILDLWKQFKEMKKNKTLTYGQVRKIRIKLCRQFPIWKSFSASHPLIFDRIVDHRTGEEEINALLYMISIKEKQNSGKIQNGLEHIKEYIFHKFAVSEEEFRAKNKDGDVRIMPAPEI